MALMLLNISLVYLAEVNWRATSIVEWIGMVIDPSVTLLYSMTVRPVIKAPNTASVALTPDGRTSAATEGFLTVSKWTGPMKTSILQGWHPSLILGKKGTVDPTVDEKKILIMCVGFSITSFTVLAHSLYVSVYGW